MKVAYVSFLTDLTLWSRCIDFIIYNAFYGCYLRFFSGFYAPVMPRATFSLRVAKDDWSIINGPTALQNQLPFSAHWPLTCCQTGETNHLGSPRFSFEEPLMESVTSNARPRPSLALSLWLNLPRCWFERVPGNHVASNHAQFCTKCKFGDMRTINQHGKNNFMCIICIYIYTHPKHISGKLTTSHK